MQRFIVLLTFISVLAVLSSCSSKTSLLLIDSEAEINIDKNKVSYTISEEGKEEVKEATPLTMDYTFQIKNKGNKHIGNLDKRKSLSIKIEPNEKFLNASQEAVGFNALEPGDYNVGSVIDYEYSFRSELEPNETGEFRIYYSLGLDESFEEHLEILKNNALEATLIVLVGEDEVAHFDLSKKE